MTGGGTIDSIEKLGIVLSYADTTTTNTQKEKEKKKGSDGGDCFRYYKLSMFIIPPKILIKGSVYM